MSRWTLFSEAMPEHGPVLVTNNPAARNAFGRMSHVWVCETALIFRDEKTGRAYMYCGHRQIWNVIAWSEIDGAPAYGPAETRASEAAVRATTEAANAS